MKLKFDKRYRRYIQSFLLVVPMTGIVTAVTMNRWGICILVAFPAVLFMQPLAAKITDHLIKADQE